MRRRSVADPGRWCRSRQTHYLVLEVTRPHRSISPASYGRVSIAFSKPESHSDSQGATSRRFDVFLTGFQSDIRTIVMHLREQQRFVHRISQRIRCSLRSRACRHAERGKGAYGSRCAGSKRACYLPTGRRPAYSDGGDPSARRCPANESTIGGHLPSWRSQSDGRRLSPKRRL